MVPNWVKIGQFVPQGTSKCRIADFQTQSSEQSHREKTFKTYKNNQLKKRIKLVVAELKNSQCHTSSMVLLNS